MLLGGGWSHQACPVVAALTAAVEILEAAAPQLERQSMAVADQAMNIRVIPKTLHPKTPKPEPFPKPLTM